MHEHHGFHVVHPEVLFLVVPHGPERSHCHLLGRLFLELAVGGIALAVGILVAFFLIGNITKPLEKAVEMIREMGMGHLGMRLKMDRRDEIGVMAQTMDRFAARSTESAG